MNNLGIIHIFRVQAYSGSNETASLCTEHYIQPSFLSSFFPSFVCSVICDMFRPVLGHDQRSNSYTSLEFSAILTFVSVHALTVGYCTNSCDLLFMTCHSCVRTRPTASLIIRMFRISPWYHTQDTSVKTAVIPSHVRECEWFSSLLSSRGRNLLQITLQTNLFL